jgi:hypothetical protein
VKQAVATAAVRDNAHAPGYRLAVLSRLAAAVFGGYALATMLPILLSHALPMPKAEAVMTAVLLSFVVYTCAILWAFAAGTAAKAWSGLLIPTAACTALWWMVA